LTPIEETLKKCYYRAMFEPKTDRIKTISIKNSDRIKELECVFAKSTHVYIDYANVRPWSNKLGWHVDEKRLKQFLDSFDTIKAVKFYYGTLEGSQESESFMNEVQHLGYAVQTKPVKTIPLSINVTSISPTSPDILKEFIRKPLMQKLKIETVEYLNGQLLELNKQGTVKLEDKKCNFDVEIGCEMMLDRERHNIETYCLWSGDCDFEDVITKLLSDNRKVILFCTARRVSNELNVLTSKGLLIYDIQKIKDFICWKRELK
jgi:uncharacterized LabA/DUF88 family protein